MEPRDLPIVFGKHGFFACREWIEFRDREQGKRGRGIFASPSSRRKHSMDDSGNLTFLSRQCFHFETSGPDAVTNNIQIHSAVF